MSDTPCHTTSAGQRSTLPEAIQLPDDTAFLIHAHQGLELRAVDAVSIRLPPMARVLPRGQDLIGTTIDDRFVLTGRLGAGGMGVVYDGLDRESGQPVAVKVMHPELMFDRRAVRRMRREARVVADCASPHVVQLLHVGTLPNGALYLAMERLRGTDLGAFLKANPRLSPARAVGILTQVLVGLGTVHAHGVIHRDIKPENIFVEVDGDGDRVKVIDFGVARTEPQAGVESKLTTSGEVLGTPRFMAPELYECGLDASPRTDIYSLGLVAWHMLAGHSPFEGLETIAEIWRAAAVDGPRSLAEVAPHVPLPIVRVVEGMIQRDPWTRYERTEDVLAALHAARAETDAIAAASVAPQTVVPADPTSSPRAEKARGSRRWGVIAACLAFVALLVWAVVH